MHLQPHFDETLGGEVKLLGLDRAVTTADTDFRQLIKRAGRAHWDRTWHNLRASRQTEPAATFPLATACAWIGNTKAIAAGHYLQVTDADWTRATGAPESGKHSKQKATQHVSASVRTASADDQKSIGNKALREPRQ